MAYSGTKRWTVDSRLAHLGYDFDPLTRTIIGLQASVYFLRVHREYPSRSGKGVNVFYGDEVAYLDRAIGEALKDREEHAYREELREFFMHYGKHPGQRKEIA